MGKIELLGLREEFRVGHTVEERSFPQVISLDVEICLDFLQANKNINLDDTVDYRLIVSLFKEQAALRDWVLLENLVKDLGNIVLDRFPIVKSINLSAIKNVLTNVKQVRVSQRIER